MPILSEAPQNLSTVPLDEHLQLLTKAVQHQNENRPGVNIVILESQDFKKHLTNDNIDDKFKSSRYQIILKSGYHYTAVDLDKTKTPPSCLILDAANDPRCLHIKKSVSSKPFFSSKIAHH